MNRQNLVITNEYILIAENHVAEQEARIKRFAADDLDTTNAEEVLVIFKQTLKGMYAYRAHIVAALNKQSTFFYMRSPYPL